MSTARPTIVRARTYRFSRLWRRPPLLVHLAAFAFVVLIPALLFSAFLILQSSQQQLEITTAQVSDAAENVSSSVDREIVQMLTAAKVLASSSFIEDEDLATFRDRATAAMSMTGYSATLIDSALKVVADTRRIGLLATEATPGAQAAEAVFRTRLPQISDVFPDPAEPGFVFHVAVPVIRGDRVVYVLAIAKRTGDLGAALAQRNLPRTWTAVIKDGSGHKVIAAQSNNGRMSETDGASFDNPSIAQALGDRMSGDLIEASYNSVLSNWTTTVAVPDSVIARPALRSWLLLVGMGILLLAFSAALAVFFGRRLAAPLLALAVQAKAIGRGEPALPVGTNIEEIGEVSKILAQASRDRRDAEEQNRFLMREMTHRAKNQYALIAAIARRAAKESANTTEFLATLSEALGSLARSADLLAGRGWESASLGDLVNSQLKAFGAGRSEQIETAGPLVKLNPTAAQTIGLALHELATNAAKYGALSAEDGYVRVEWSLGERFSLTWTEHGGPPVVAPKRSGFGTLVTQKMTARGLGGDVDMKYARSGVVWTLTTPRDTVLSN